MTPPSYKLNTGAYIPSIGLGTWQAEPGQVAEAVSHALKSGYRHIDGAFDYGNEAEVGEGIRASGVQREKIFITSKLWCTGFRWPEKQLDQTLSDLGVDYIDLYLMHWPVPLNPWGNDPMYPRRPDGARDLDDGWTYEQTWLEMEKLLATGKVKAIGVSNCSRLFIENILKVATVVPAVNQVELHVYNPQLKLHEYCKSKGILICAYSPLGSTGSPLMSEPLVLDLAKKYSVSPATILLSYLNNRGVPALPKSVTPSRIESNLIVIKMDKSDVKKLSAIAATGKQHRFCKPDWPVDLGFDDWENADGSFSASSDWWYSRAWTWLMQLFSAPEPVERKGFPAVTTVEEKQMVFLSEKP